MVKRKKKKEESFGEYLNNSKFFAGLVMILLNIGSKYIEIDLSKSQEYYLKHSVARQLLVFSISWMGTRDFVTAVILTAAFHVITQYLLNEKSDFCILPKSMQKSEKDLKDAIDTDGDGKISKDEIEKAIDILKKAQKKS